MPYTTHHTAIPKFEQSGNPQRKPYVYHYTYYYTWLNQHQSLVASCMLNPNRKLLLTNKNLEVITRSVINKQTYRLSIPLRQIESLEVRHKKLILPLIVGGIVAPFSTVATLLRLVGFWSGMGVVIAGLLLVYYGWVGTQQFSIVFAKHQLNYFSDYQHLRAFGNMIDKTMWWKNTK